METIQPEHTPSARPAVEAHTRGLNPLAALSFVRDRGGDAAIKEVLRRLPEKDLQILSGTKKLSSKAWVPFGLQARLLTSIDRSMGEGDLAKLFEVGRYMSTRDIPRVFRPLLKLGNPGWILEVSTRMWRFYHDRGHWEVQRTPVTVLATLHDHPDSHEAFCATFIGWLTGALELSGGYDVMVDHPVCHARGAPQCVFTARWSLDAAPPGLGGAGPHDGYVRRGGVPPTTEGRSSDAGDTSIGKKRPP